MNLRIGRMVIGAVQTNCYFVYDEDQEGSEKDVLFFDPADKGAYIYDQLKSKGFWRLPSRQSKTLQRSKQSPLRPHR